MKPASRKRMVLTCALFVCTSFLEVAFVYFTADLLQQSADGNVQGMIRSAIMNAGLTVLIYLVSVLTTKVRLSFISGELIHFRDKIMRNLFARPLSSFRGQNDAYYLNLLGADMDAYGRDRIGNIPYMCGCTASIVFNAAMLLSLSPWLFLAGCTLSAAPLFVGKLFAKQTQKSNAEASEAAEKYTGLLKESIEGYETIRMTESTDACLERFHQASTARQRAADIAGLANRNSMDMLFTMSRLLVMGCTVVGGVLILQGRMTAALMIAAVNYTSGLSNAFSNISEILVEYRSMKTIQNKLEYESCESADVMTISCYLESGEVEYNDVSFSFGDRKIISHFSYRFEPGRCYAILGESGSGKSTLMRLLLGYYRDFDGRILLDGKNIKDIGEDTVYQHVGALDQSPYLFNASLYDNITMFRKDAFADDAAYRRLLRDVHLTSLSAQVGDKPLGDFGDHISGGERQRIHLARALLNHPQVMIFDEPTTGLDPENVTLINELIFSHKELTRIVITHNWDPKYLDRFDDVIHMAA